MAVSRSKHITISIKSVLHYAVVIQVRYENCVQFKEE